MSARTESRFAPGGTYPLGPYEVARFGYGAMQLRNFAADPGTAVAVLQRAIELGVNHIDTAQFYGDGLVNRFIRQALPKDDSVVIASKVGATHNPNGKVPVRLAQKPDEIRASIEENLVSLGVERLPLVNLRRADVGPGVHAEGDQVVAIDDQMAVLLAMRDEGKIGAIGLSGVHLESFDRVLPAGIACVQNAYSLVSREFEDLLSACSEHKVAWVPFFPLGGAAPGWPKVTEQPAVIALALELGITPSQLGLAWLLQHQPNILLIPGTGNLAHLEENVASASVVLDEEAFGELSSLSAIAHSH